MTESKKLAGGPYRARDGLLFGVAKGLADHFGFSVFWIRLALVALALLTALWPVMVFYAAAAFLMPPRPSLEPRTEAERKAFRRAVFNPTDSLRDIQAASQSLERRLRRLEDAVTSKDFDWQRRFNQ